MRFLDRFLNRKQRPIIVVSGLPRSGTSMMMRMLERGGVPLLTDGVRTANEDNPKGYYEFERVKKLPQGDYGWLPEAQGKAVKIIATLLKHLPETYTYRVLFMRRNMEEVLASQRQMLIRRGKAPDSMDEEQLAKSFAKHVAEVKAWLATRPNFRCLDVDYNTMVVDPMPQLRHIQAFLDLPLDLAAMAAEVDPTLYRQRRVATLSMESSSGKGLHP